MKKGFTLLELIVVIIIIGVLASLATAQYIRIVEKARAAEGAYLLGLLRAAQMRYYTDNYTYATDRDDLDVEYTAPQYFTVDTPAGTSAEVAAVTRTGGYTLKISETGTISCSGTAGITCAQAGY